ncbi:hypothetical protein Tco_0810248 [Tanacetum coccineum]
MRLAKLPMLKLGEYKMWEIRIKQYFQIQDYALWEMIVALYTKKTFSCFGGNDAIKKTQKALLKQQYENFNATSSESLDSIFNRLQKLVSRLAILGVDTPPEDLNVKFLRSLPSEWDTHVVVWMNKPDFDTMGLDDLYNNFKIVEQKVKRTAAANNDDKNLAFLTTSSPSSTNTINTVNTGVSTGTTKVNTASTETSTASFSDATVYAFLSTQPQGSQLVHEDLEQLHDDDLEEMDLKWNMALLSMRARNEMQKSPAKEKSPKKVVEEEVDTQEELKEVVKEPRAKRKKSIPRKSIKKRQKLEEDAEKEELKGFLDIIPREEVPIEVESISTKFPIVDWKTYVLTETFMYYQVFRGDGSSKNYKILSEMLEDFDRLDVEELQKNPDSQGKWYTHFVDGEWVSNSYVDREEISFKSRDDFQDAEEEIREVKKCLKESSAKEED